MPAPRPEAPPVTIAVLPVGRMSPLFLCRHPPDDAVGIGDAAAPVAVTLGHHLLNHGSAGGYRTGEGRVRVRHIDVDATLFCLVAFAHHDDGVVHPDFCVHDSACLGGE